MAEAKPNILFVMADQLAAQFLPFHGHPLVQDAPPVAAGGRRRRLRELLFDEPALRARPRDRDERPAAVAHRRL